MAAPLHRDLVEVTPPVWPAAPRVLWRVALGRRRASAGRLLCRQDLLHGLLEQGLQSPGGVGGGICGPAVGPAAAAARAAGAQRAPCGVGLAYVHRLRGGRHPGAPRRVDTLRAHRGVEVLDVIGRPLRLRGRVDQQGRVVA
jgi:hypothetical protein